MIKKFSYYSSVESYGYYHYHYSSKLSQSTFSRNLFLGLIKDLNRIPVFVVRQRDEAVQRMAPPSLELASHSGARCAQRPHKPTKHLSTTLSHIIYVLLLSELLYIIVLSKNKF